MKLPDDPKERKQYIILGVIVLAAAAYGIFTFVIQPSIANRKQRAEQITEISRRLEMAESRTRLLRSNRETAVKLAADVVTNTQNYVIEPALGGNYLLVAQDIIETIATDTGVRLESIRQTGLSTLPNSPNRSQRNEFGAYTIQLSMQSSLEDFTRFVKAVEDSNPYLSITGLSVLPQPGNPQRHIFNLQITWPRWLRENTLRNLLGQLES